MRTTLLFGLAALLAVPASARPQDEARDTDALIGTYTIVSGHAGDEEIPREELQGRAVIAEDRMTLYDDDNNERYVVDYRVEEKGDDDVCKITMRTLRSTRGEAEGMTARGLIKSDGETLTLIYSHEGEDYPDDFEPDGEHELKFVLKKASESE